MRMYINGDNIENRGNIENRESLFPIRSLLGTLCLLNGYNLLFA